MDDGVNDFVLKHESRVQRSQRLSRYMLCGNLVLLPGIVVSSTLPGVVGIVAAAFTLNLLASLLTCIVCSSRQAVLGTVCHAAACPLFILSGLAVADIIPRDFAGAAAGAAGSAGDPSGNPASSLDGLFAAAPSVLFLCVAVALAGAGCASALAAGLAAIAAHSQRALDKHNTQTASDAAAQAAAAVHLNAVRQRGGAVALGVGAPPGVLVGRPVPTTALARSRIDPSFACGAGAADADDPVTIQPMLMVLPGGSVTVAWPEQRPQPWQLQQQQQPQRRLQPQPGSFQPVTAVVPVVASHYPHPYTPPIATIEHDRLADPC